MSAPQAVVDVQMREYGCAPVGKGWRECAAHPGGLNISGGITTHWTSKGCPVAIRAAEESWATSLRAAADRLHAHGDNLKGWRTVPAVTVCRVAARLLRTWADEVGEPS